MNAHNKIGKIIFVLMILAFFVAFSGCVKEEKNHFLNQNLDQSLDQNLDQNAPVEETIKIEKVETQKVKENNLNEYQKWYDANYWKSHPLKGAVIELSTRKKDLPDENSLKTLKEFGAQLINLEVQYTWNMYPPYERNKTQIENIHQVLKTLKDLNFKVILAIRNGPGRDELFSELEDEDKATRKIYYEKQTQDAWMKMLEDTINEFKSYENIIAWEPIVEPSPYEYFEKIYDENVEQKSAEWWNKFAERSIEVIRKVDSRPIVIESADWGYPQSFKYLKKFNDPNIIYSIHYYWPFTYTHQPEGIKYKYPGKICFWQYEGDWKCEFVNKKILERELKAVDEFVKRYNVPILVGEYGGMRFVPGIDIYVKDLIEIFDSRNWSHTYYAWGLDPGWEIQAFRLECGTDINNLSPNIHAKTFEPIYTSWHR